VKRRPCPIAGGLFINKGFKAEGAQSSQGSHQVKEEGRNAFSIENKLYPVQLKIGGIGKHLRGGSDDTE
jgi:hypothetical protein